MWNGLDPILKCNSVGVIHVDKLRGLGYNMLHLLPRKTLWQRGVCRGTTQTQVWGQPKVREDPGGKRTEVCGT